jgi:hypothetical protein
LSVRGKSILGGCPGRIPAGLRACGKASPSALLAVTLVGSLWLSFAAEAATYKWTDDKGVVHYSDKVPPEAIEKGSLELSKEGIPLRRTEPAPTAEQRKAREAEEERKRLLAKQQEESERRDRALLASYTSEREIDLSRQRSLATIEAVIESAQHYTDQLGRRKIEVEARRAGFRDKPVPAVLEREFESINAELVRQADFIRQKRAEWATTATRYDADRARWRELSGIEKPVQAATTTHPSSAPAKPPPLAR